jgi:bifunctional DNA-binding transcriptional regulator/antitoxin component of YhaV-PrlF toxin-antitoxin module
MSEERKPIDLTHLREKRDRFDSRRIPMPPVGPAEHRRGFRRYRVSSVGQMTLPAEARRRWGVARGGEVEVADLGFAVVVLPPGGSDALLAHWLSDAELAQEARMLLLDARRRR